MATGENGNKQLEAEAFRLFTAIGLEENTAKNALVNPKFLKALVEVIHEAGCSSGCPKAVGNLLYTTASKYPANALSHRPLLLTYVVEEKIKTTPQLEGAFDYLKKVGSMSVDNTALEEASGVGVVVTADQIQAAVSNAIEKAAVRLREERYHFNQNILLGQVTRGLKWADVALVRAELEAQISELLGPKTEADLKPIEKKKKTKAPASNDPFAALPKPKENNAVHTVVTFSSGSVMRIANTPERLAEHLAATGGKVVTRFPPEPNGYLHIGHAKAMFVDFGMAAQYGGHCYLRYDDTNPEAEKLEYIEHIEEIVAWMGWKPWKITYASDYFQQLYDFAVELIKRGHAYVCHQTKEEIEASRDKLTPSPWRDRPAAESLALFEDMRRGMLDEGEAILRMKMDYKNENPNMWDQVAYRIKYVAHPHAGDKWCVYPTYDFTHCLVDALENITHSLCTLEFESRRASYYWLLEVLDTYKPYVWEYSRLNITNNVMSKRKLNRLVTQGHVRGWDDPRLLTLAGLRRRGANAVAINAFCRDMGITRNKNVIPLHKLEHHIRADLDANAPRALAVLRPLKLVFANLAPDHFEEVEAQRFPGRDGSAYKVPLTRTAYIEATDFRVQDAPDYYGLAPGKTVMLRYAYPATYKSHSVSADGAVTEVVCELDRDFLAAGRAPPKGVLNWVSEPKPGQAPLTFEARLVGPLFNADAPEELGDAWLDDLNKDSLAVLTGCFANQDLADAKVFDKFQFERLGYFCVDTDSRPGALVVNRTVTLRDSYAKGK